MQAIILDTETTGTDDPEIIEAAWIDADGGRQYYSRLIISGGC